LLPVFAWNDLHLVVWPALVAAGVGVVALVQARRIADIRRTALHDFTFLAQSVTDRALYALTPDGKVASWNIGAEKLKGYTAAEAIGLSLGTFYAAEDRAAGQHEQVLAIARDTGIYRGEGWRCRKDGSRFWADVTVQPVRDAGGRLTGYVKITHDLTLINQDRQRLAAMQAQRDCALDNMAQGLILFDHDARLALVNQRFHDLWPIPRDRLRVGMTVSELFDVLLDSRDVSDRGFLHERLVNCLLPHDHQPKDDVWIDWNDDFAVSVSWRGLPDGGWVASFTDVSERRRDRARIARLAAFDSLTGLLGRDGFAARLDQALAAAAGTGQQLAMVILDLYEFRAVNDRYGHAFGNQLIRSVGARLAEECCAEVTIGRSGDQFLIAGTFAHRDELDRFVGDLGAIFDGPFLNDDHFLQLSVRLGIACYPDHACSGSKLITNAELALQRAKDDLGGRPSFFDPDQDEGERNRRTLAGELRGAVERGELRVVFQPQHALRSGELVGYEALVRWHHPVRGEVSPLDFIPIAEETGEIFAIGEWVLAETARIAVGWPDHLKVAVNLSPVQFQQEDLLQRITAVLLNTGLATRRLEFEITESAIMKDRSRALHLMRRIKSLGMTISIDDFGTGHSSFDTLQMFPFDKIKIDKGFLRQIGSNPQSESIVRAIIALGHGLGIAVLAEGIETEPQRAMLIAEGCDLGQGYLFGRPQRAELLDHTAHAVALGEAEHAANVTPLRRRA